MCLRAKNFGEEGISVRRDTVFVQYGLYSRLEALAVWCVKVWCFRNSAGMQQWAKSST